MKRRPSLGLLLLGSCLCLFAPSVVAHPLGPEDATAYAAANEALERGAHTEAIQQLELLADRGILHPDLSFDRAIAYARRGRSAQTRPGDLGHAAYALSETLAQRPDDAEAKALLDRITEELSRARSRRGNPSLLARPRLSRAIVGLLPENVWAIGSMVFSAITTLGILARFGTKGRRPRLGGAVAALLGAMFLILTSGGLLFAAHQRRTTRQGVVVSTEARLLDVGGVPVQAGRRIGHDLSIPEGARVVVTGRTERLLEVEWGNIEAYVSPSDVLLLPPQR